MRNKTKIQESITNMSNLGLIPADEKQLNLDVVYNSILDEVCSVVSMDSPRQIIAFLRLVYDSEEKSVRKTDKEDVYGTNLMNGVGAMPLDENGYVTEIVNFETITNVTDGTAKFLGKYKNIVPTTIVISDNGVEIIDNGQGKLLNTTTEKFIGTVDYQSALFTFTTTSDKVTVRYIFDIYDIITSRNFAKFVRDNIEMFAEMFQLDVDSALVLDDFKGVNLRDNIKNIVPQVLSQQIDNHVLSNYFNYVDEGMVHTNTWDAQSITWPYDKGYSVTDFYKDFGTLVSLEMSLFSRRTGVMPNIILCDPISYGVLSINHNFSPINKDETEDIKYSGMPRLVGYFNSAKVILVQNNEVITEETKEKGRLVITYKGPSEAQSAGVYSSYIPVTLRTVQGAEGGGMIVTNNAYSMGSFAVTNPELISGVKLINLNPDLQP